MTDLKRFEYVLALGEYMNFSQAARHLKISQSTLSQYIQKLEKEIGVSLFDRSVTPLQLTQYGEIYIAGARKIMDAYTEILDSICDADAGVGGSVRIGLSPSRAGFMLPGVIDGFRRLYPDATLKFIESKSEEIMKNLDEGNIDFAYTVVPEKFESEDYVVCDAGTERIMLAAVKSSDAPEGSTIDFSRAENFTFILLEENQLLTEIFYSLCKKSGVSPEKHISVSELSTAISLVKNGMGVMLLPSSYRDYGTLSEELDFFDIRQADFERKLAVIYKKDKYVNKPMRALVKIMCNNK